MSLTSDRGLSRFGEAMVCIIIGSGCVLAGAYSARQQPVPVPTVTMTQPAWADGCTTDTDCADMERSLNDAGLVLTGGGNVEQVTEDSPWWNCLTMGNRTCGPQFEDVDTATMPDGSPVLDVLTEGERQDWTGCLIEAHTMHVVCSDGYVETS